jgi:hypothetical protein
MTTESISNDQWEFDELVESLIPLYEPDYKFIHPTLEAMSQRTIWLVKDLLAGTPLAEAAMRRQIGKGTAEVRVRRLHELMLENDSMVLIDNAQKKS